MAEELTPLQTTVQDQMKIKAEHLEAIAAADQAIVEATNAAAAAEPKNLAEAIKAALAKFPAA
jgi:acetyl-CoA carboxylase alpha subunit